MANITVYAWSAPAQRLDQIAWDKSAGTKISSPGTVTVPTGTQAIVVTTSADTWMTFDGSTPSAGAGVPVLGAVYNFFPVSVDGGGMVLTFQ